MKEHSYVSCFSVLSNELRMSILSELEKGESNVGDIVQEIKADQSRVSHALRQLKKCGFVKSRVEGKERFYSLRQETFDSLKAKKGESMLDIAKRHYENCPFKEERK